MTSEADKKDYNYISNSRKARAILNLIFGKM